MTNLKAYLCFKTLITSFHMSCFLGTPLSQWTLYVFAPLKRARRKNMSAEEQLLSEPSMYTNVQNWAGDLISGNTTTGRILVVFAFGCSIAALVLYIWGKRQF